MLPAVSVSSSALGRTRLKVDSSMRQSEFFDRVVGDLKRFPGVASIEANRLTGSILLHHTVPLDVLKEYAQRRNQLFVVESPADESQAKRAREARRRARRRPGDEIRLSREARSVLGTLGFFGFCGLGVYQLMRGQTLPAGFNLFLKGFSFLNMETGGKPETEVATVD